MPAVGTGVATVLIVIDNYDSFTYNIVQYLRELGAKVQVYRNDEITCDELEAADPAGLILSPGPGMPDAAGIGLKVVERFASRLPMLGVCLGHQIIGQIFGGEIVHAKQIMHGKMSAVHHNGTGVFVGLPSPLTVTRYHSLVINNAAVPSDLEITAWTQTEDGLMDEIMGVRHTHLALQGVQFHPESIRSEYGHELLGNFLTQAGII